MNRKNQHNTRVLTLTIESETINHQQDFRDSRRGNRALNQTMKAFQNLNIHNNEKRNLSTFVNKILPDNTIKATITHK